MQAVVIEHAQNMMESGKNDLHRQQQYVYSDSFREFTCGWGASFINIAVTYPIYKVMFRQVSQHLSQTIMQNDTFRQLNIWIWEFQMLHGVEITSAIQELRHEGFAFLYRGILPPLAQKTISLSLMFGVYDGTKRPLVQLGMNEYLAKIIAGVTAGKCDKIAYRDFVDDSTTYSNCRHCRSGFNAIRTNPNPLV